MWVRNNKTHARFFTFPRRVWPGLDVEFDHEGASVSQLITTFAFTWALSLFLERDLSSTFPYLPQCV